MNVKSEEPDEKIIGDRVKNSNDKVIYWCAFDLTPWQINLLLPKVISITRKEYMGRQIFAIGFNKSDSHELNLLVDMEDMNILRK